MVYLKILVLYLWIIFQFAQSQKLSSNVKHKNSAKLMTGWTFLIKLHPKHVSYRHINKVPGLFLAHLKCFNYLASTQQCV